MPVPEQAVGARRAAALLCALLLTPAAARAQQAVAVLPFEDAGSMGIERAGADALGRGLAGLLSEALRNRLAEAPVVPRAAVQRAYDQHPGRARPRMDAATAAAVARAVGARVAVAGTFVDFFGRLRIDARVIDAASGRIVAVVSTDPNAQERAATGALLEGLASEVARAGDLTLAPPRPAPAPAGMDAVLYYSRALLARDRGDEATAASLLRQALAAAPGFTPARNELGSP